MLKLELINGLSDKVRVDEVQDALKRMTESLYAKFEAIETKFDSETGQFKE